MSDDGDRPKKGSRRRRGKTKPEAPETPPVDPAAETRTDAPDDSSAGEEEARPRIKLPAFGMAEDLLREIRKQREGGGETEVDDPTTASPGASAPSGEDHGAATELASELSPEDPERVYRFAEGLQEASSSRIRETEVERVRLEPFVTFDLAGEVFALPVKPIRQVMRISGITRVPHAPQPIRGVTNLRGRVIPVIDLRQRIGLPQAELEKTHRIIVVTARHRLIGLLVDAVRQVVHLDTLQIQPPPEDVMTVQSDYISGIVQLERGLILLLDVERSLVIQSPGAA